MYQFEKNKLYAHLGKDLVSLFRKHKCYVAGGTVTSLFANNPINDIDVYFRDEQSLIDFLYEAWDEQYYMVAHTKKATLFKCGDADVQLVHVGYFATPQDIFDKFDFTVNMGCFDFATEEFTLHENFMQHNSQRILKFNKATAFPLVSMLRVQKYRDKGYTISKPEYIRIMLACMNLNITSYAELKEHMGGMYGVNYDKLFKFDDNEEFSFDRVIDAIADLYLDEDYFKMPDTPQFNEVDDIIENIVNVKPRYFELNDKVFIVSYRDTLREMRDAPENGERIDGEEYVRNLKLYKYVKKVGGKYISFWDNKFEYVIGEEMVEKGGKLFFNELKNIGDSSYAYNKERVLIEATIQSEDLLGEHDNTVYVRKCVMTREVPAEEVTPHA